MRLNASDPDIQTLYHRIESGDLNLQPDFQRGEVWNDKKKQKLVDSILRDWHVPPIHIILVEETDQQEILDGQQRLVAIRDFVRGALKIDGHTHPSDPDIERLDGLTYPELPLEYKRRVDRFSIRQFLITNYKPDEPWELFFRLNQPMLLTPAEQRNAFYGPVRKQIKELVQTCQHLGLDEDSLGFSNARMAYDDIVARLCYALEASSLSVKVGPGTLANLYRSDTSFSDETTQRAEAALALFAECIRDARARVKFTKATLLSWLLVMPVLEQHIGRTAARWVADTIVRFEERRRMVKSKNLEENIFSSRSPSAFSSDPTQAALLLSFNAKSSSRIFEPTSIIVRDFVIWYFLFHSQKISDSTQRELESIPKYAKMSSILNLSKQNNSPVYSEDLLEMAVAKFSWGDEY